MSVLRMWKCFHLLIHLTRNQIVLLPWLVSAPHSAITMNLRLLVWAVPFCASLVAAEVNGPISPELTIQIQIEEKVEPSQVQALLPFEDDETVGFWHVLLEEHREFRLGDVSSSWSPPFDPVLTKRRIWTGKALTLPLYDYVPAGGYSIPIRLREPIMPEKPRLRYWPLLASAS
jgi:hypothetical protein